GELLGSPDHPAHDVIQGEKVWLRTLFEDLAAAAGLEEPVCLGSQLLALLEGATVLRSITGQPGAVTAARAAAQILIGSDPPARALGPPPARQEIVSCFGAGTSPAR